MKCHFLTIIYISPNCKICWQHNSNLIFRHNINFIYLEFNLLENISSLFHLEISTKTTTASATVKLKRLEIASNHWVSTQLGFPPTWNEPATLKNVIIVIIIIAFTIIVVVIQILVAAVAAIIIIVINIIWLLHKWSLKFM